MAPTYLVYVLTKAHNKGGTDMSKLMFGKLISKLQLSKSPEEREGEKHALILNNFSMHRPISVK